MLSTNNNKIEEYIGFIREEENKVLQMFGEEELNKAKEECKQKPISYVEYLKWKTKELLALRKPKRQN